MGKTSKIILVTFLVAFLVTSTVLFWQGYHNIDLAQNFLRLGYEEDQLTNGHTMHLLDLYTAGTRQIHLSHILSFIAMLLIALVTKEVLE